MNINFELYFFISIIICSVITIFDFIYLSPKRNRTKSKKLPLIIDYARSFLPVLLVVFSLRSFAYEPRYIPSGSLKPTLLVGDFILVNKFNYGIRLPVVHKKIFSINEPKRGDIVVFRGPSKLSVDMIKRVIGVPGDHISYVNKVLYFNSQKVNQDFKKYSVDQNEDSDSWKVAQKQENLLGIKHDIYQIPDRTDDDFYNVVVPEGKYFMMGDNRDNSDDSRSWGFMPEKDIIGKATRVLISWDKPTHPVRWNRIAEKIV